MEEAIKQKKSFKEVFKKIKKAISNFFGKALSTNKTAILLMAGLLIFVMTVYFILIYTIRNNFYQNWSDDSLQYYPFMVDFIDSIKSGTFSLFNFKNYLGASFFSDTYYIPLDPFTLIIFLLSFIFRTEIAMSIVELLKLISGAIAISSFLAIRGYKPKTVFLIGLLYFSSSGITCFSCFPCFTSLAFYLPFSLIIGHYFIKGKWYFVPIYAMIVVFYNFYLAYTAFAFMCFSMIVLLILDRGNFFKGLLKLVIYVVLILLGLCMAMVVFLPSMDFILKSTSRDVASGGSVKGLLILSRGYVEVAISAITCTFKTGINIFKTPTGLLKNRMFFMDGYLPLRQLYRTLLTKRTVDDLKVLASFFNVEEYYRVMSTTFTPVTPSSFYGYQSSYFIEHVSLYITGAGLVLTSYIWFMKGFKANVFKGTMIVSIFMMLLPFFSYIYSANLDVLYTRWFNVISIPMLIIAGYTMDSEGLFELKPKKLIGSFVILAYFGIFGSYHHLYNIRYYGLTNEWSEDVLSFESKLFYFTVLVFFIIVFLFASLYMIGKLAKKKRWKIMLGIGSGLLTIGFVLWIGLYILGLYKGIPKELWTTEIKQSTLFDTTEMMAFQYLTFVTLIMIVITIYSIVAKKKVLLGIIIFIEFFFSAGLSFGSNFIREGRVKTFKKSHEFGEFLDENTDTEDIYRVYVDSSISGVLSYNIARFTNVGTNQRIFHSFIYAGTDEVAGIIYDKSDEGQAGKKALNTYSYYLNILLGYRYIVSSPVSSFSNYNTSQFNLVTETDDYLLLEFKDYEEFLVFNKYTSRESFNDIKSKLKEISRIKLMLNTPIVEEDYLETIEKYYDSETNISSYTDTTTSTSIFQRVAFKSRNASCVYLDEDTDGVKKSGWYYRYAFEGDDEITTRSYAINIFDYSDTKTSMVQNNEIFLKLNNGDLRYLTTGNIISKGGSTFHIPVYGLNDVEARKPEGLYVFYSETEESTNVPLIKYSAEAIFPKPDHIEAYEKGDPIDGELGLEAAMKFHVTSSFNDRVVRITLNKLNTSTTLAFTTIYFEYDDGTISHVSNEVFVDKTIKNIYIVKSTESYNLSSPPQIKITSYDIDDAYSDNYTNKEVTTKKSSITISYTNNNVEEGYDIIMIPTAYSDEWEVVSGNVLDTLPVNGGFIGLIVPRSIESNTITIKFVPTGMKFGLNVSIVSILFYIGIMSNYFVYKKKKEVYSCQL